MKFDKEELIDIEKIDFESDYNHVFKIGHGPNALINMAPCRACRHLSKELKNIKTIKSIDVYLYKEFARSVKETLVDRDIKRGLSTIKVPVKFYTDKQPKDDSVPALTFDVILRNKSKKEIKRYTISSLGAGSYCINGVNEPLAFPYTPYVRSLEYIKCHPYLKPYDCICQYIEEWAVKLNLDRCIKIMDKLIDNGLKVKGKLPLKHLKVTYFARAKKIYDNKKPNETENQKMIRLISSYAYAIGEQIVLGKEMVASPTGSTSPVVWSVLRYLREKYKPTKKQIYYALGNAILICNNICFSSEISSHVGGCQAAMATATAMATAIAASILYDADFEEVGRAAEMAIEHTLGLICNSVCAVPLVPCIQRSASFACRAYELAVLNHSLMKTKQLIRFDDAAAVLSETGKDLVSKYKIAGIEGFAKTARYSLFKNEKKKGAK